MNNDIVSLDSNYPAQATPSVYANDRERGAFISSKEHYINGELD